MTIKVVFGKNGFYHPNFGRLGRGDNNRGKVYTLPDEFAEKGMLPTSARILESEEEVSEALEEAEQKVPEKPKMVDPDVFKEKVTGRGTVKSPDSAQKRTTGSDKKPLK